MDNLPAQPYWYRARRDVRIFRRTGEDWAIVTEFDQPAADRFMRRMAVFTREPTATCRRDDERHQIVLVDARRIPAYLADCGTSAEVRSSFEAEMLPAGLLTLIGRRSV